MDKKHWVGALLVAVGAVVIPVLVSVSLPLAKEGSRVAGFYDFPGNPGFPVFGSPQPRQPGMRTAGLYDFPGNPGFPVFGSPQPRQPGMRTAALDTVNEYASLKTDNERIAYLTGAKPGMTIGFNTTKAAEDQCGSELTAAKVYMDHAAAAAQKYGGDIEKLGSDELMKLSFFSQMAAASRADLQSCLAAE